MARAMHRRCCCPPESAVPEFGEPVLHFVPQPGAAQAFFHNRVEIALALGQAVDARAIGDVVIDRFGEGVGLLEHHAHPCAQLHHIHPAGIDILPIQLDRP